MKKEKKIDEERNNGKVFPGHHNTSKWSRYATIGKYSCSAIIVLQHKIRLSIKLQGKWKEIGLCVYK